MAEAVSSQCLTGIPGLCVTGLLASISGSPLATCQIPIHKCHRESVCHTGCVNITWWDPSFPVSILNISHNWFAGCSHEDPVKSKFCGGFATQFLIVSFEAGCMQVCESLMLKNIYFWLIYRLIDDSSCIDFCPIKSPQKRVSSPPIPPYLQLQLTSSKS